MWESRTVSKRMKPTPESHVHRGLCKIGSEPVYANALSYCVKRVAEALALCFLPCVHDSSGDLQHAILSRVDHYHIHVKFAGGSLRIKSS